MMRDRRQNAFFPRPRNTFLTAAALLMAAACSGPETAESVAEAPAEVSGTAPPADLGPPLDADIFLAELSLAGDEPSARVTRNLTSRWGYDNQPHWLPDGSGLYYTAIDDDGADIWRYDVDSGMVGPVTITAPESEYSATPIPGMDAFSAIRVEADSTQRLWGFQADGSGAEVIFPELAPVGYHAWVSPTTVAMFVLGDPPTLQIGAVNEGTTTVLTQNIGRSIQKIPGEEAITFVQNLEGGGSVIMRWGGAATAAVATLPDGGDFHAWTPDGWLLMGRGSELVGKPPGVEDGSWIVLADLAPLGVGSVSRLAVSPDGMYIAIVGEPGGG